jgi:hypothetical protein
LRGIFLKIIDDLSEMMRPPFRGLVALLLIFFVWCHLVHPNSYIAKSMLLDTDDHMHFVQATDLLDGVDWFDRTIERLGGEGGTKLHFSRLVDLPLAGILSIFETIMPREYAIPLTALLMPTIMFGLLLAALVFMGRPFVDKNWVGLIALLALLQTPLTFQFMPGRVDHHAYIIVLLVLAIAATLRLIQNPVAIRFALIAGAALGFALAIALEALPWVVLLSGFLGLWLLWTGAPLRRATTYFGLSLFVTSALLLFLHKSIADILQLDFLEFSIVYVVLCNVIALLLWCLGLLSLWQKRIGRIIAGVVVGLGAIIGVLYLFPGLLTGPYAYLDSEFAKAFLPNIHEAIPLGGMVSSFADLFVRMLPPLLALLITLHYLMNPEKSQQPAVFWWLFFLFLLSAIALTLFYQARFRSYACLLSLLPILIFWQNTHGVLTKKWQGVVLYKAHLMLALSLTLFPAVLLPAMVDGRPFNSGVLLFPAEVGRASPSLSQVVAMLNLPNAYGDRARRIANHQDIGPELLLMTRHHIMAAPYHTNQNGNMTVINLLKAIKPEVAKEIIDQEGIELLLLSQEPGSMYQSGSDLLTVQDPVCGQKKRHRNPNFYEQLLAGDIPTWLIRKDIPLEGHYLLFEVKKDI